MRSFILKCIVFCIVFAGSLFYFNHASTKGSTELTAEMNQATLPVLYTLVNDMKINTLHGYTDDLDAALLRDTITPLDDGTKTMHVVIKQYKNDIKSLKYELSNINGTKVIDSGEITKFKKEKNSKTAVIKFKGKLEPGSDYSLKLTVKPDGGILTKYYTRVKYGDNLHIKDYLDFVTYFHETSFDKEKSQELVKYLETKTDGTNNNLNSVTIKSDLESITWAGLKPKAETKPSIAIKELTDEQMVLEASYILSAVNGKGVKEYYNVIEYYKVKYSSDRMYLLSFERKQEEIFNPQIIDVSKNGFKLGIGTNENIQLTYNQDCNKVAFVRERQLWYHDYKTTTMTKVFSFRQDEVFEARNDFDQHDIKIIELKDDGEITFVVYGYMNRGRHEGTNGIALYRFTPKNESIEELLYIPANQTFKTLKEDVEYLSYLNDNNMFYFALDGVINSVNCDTKEVKVLAHKVTTSNCVVSRDQSVIAIQNKATAANTTKITIYNLEDETQKQITAKSSQKIKTIGYIGQSLIYGVANDKDIVKKGGGSTIFPMHTIRMLDENLKVINTYKKKGIYVTDTAVNGQAVELTRVKKDGKKYKAESSDIIIRKEEGSANQIKLSYQFNSDWYNQLFMIYPNFVYITSSPKLITTKEVLVDDYRTVLVSGDNDSSKYFVYASGQANNSYTTASAAIKAASENQGSVVNSKQQYIWEYNATPDYATVADDISMITAKNNKESAIACVAMILQYEGVKVDWTTLVSGKNDPEVLLNQYLKNGGINLTGATLDQVLYFLGKGAPVIAKLNNHYVLLTSYNGTAIRYSDPVTKDVVRADRKDMKKLLKDNIYYSYSR